MRRAAIIPTFLLATILPPSDHAARADADALAQRQRAWEAALNAAVDPASIARTHETLAAEPHVAGTEASFRVADWLTDTFSELGYNVITPEYWVYLPRFVDASLEIVSPVAIELSIREDVLEEDPDTGHPDITPGWNAYSGSGEVEAGVVYANYGTIEDFATLREMGVSVEGKIVIARYGRNYRGYKAKFAEEAGAAGLIMYTDPADAVRGETYPHGGWAHPSQIQRGSIKTLPYAGDPLTPGVPAHFNAERLDPDDVDLPRIPVQPIGYGAAEQIISRMRGDPAPDGWHGNLPHEYRVTGGDDLRIRMRVEQVREITRIRNVLARMPGVVDPMQMVVVGSHHDSWAHGASDPLAGTMVMVEAARAFAHAAQQGMRPARTIVFAAWDAEEFGIIGSTEWVEEQIERLTRDAVAYINLDMSVMGDQFRAAASSPTLHGVIEEAARAVTEPGPDNTTSVLDAWMARIPPATPGRPRIGLLGGGSDHIGFASHAVVPSISLSMSGAEGVSYHSAYDTIAWWRKVVGDDYESARTLTQITNVILARLAGVASADGYVGLPMLSFERIAPAALAHLDALAARAKTLGVAFDRAPLDAAAARVDERAAAVEATLRARGDTQGLDAGVARTMMLVDRAWRDDEGLPERPWFRNTFVASDETSGYAAWAFPLLRREIEHRDDDALRAAVERTRAAFERVERALATLETELSE
ncbi:MAG: M28 family peptidase [Phycisphaerales bacterium]|nr:MAG: M28 family peptidase [Phycisphaerales bacterium]